MIFKKSILIATLCLVLSAEVMSKNQQEVGRYRARHYLTHILTYYLSNTVAFTTLGAGYGLTASGAVALAGDMRAAGLIPVPALIGTLLAAYMYYKTPQWTDSYILGSEQQRSSSQNVLVTFLRAALPPIINVVVGEYCAGTEDTSH